MWYRSSSNMSIESVTRKTMETLASNLLRGKMLAEHMVKPSEDEIVRGVHRVMKEIERVHGSVTKAALASPEIALRPIVEAAIQHIKW